MTQNNDPVQEAVERLLEDSVKGVGPRFPLSEVNKKHIKLALRTKIKPLLREAQRDLYSIEQIESAWAKYFSETIYGNPLFLHKGFTEVLKDTAPTEPAGGEG